jgi:hypothetical protein
MDIEERLKHLEEEEETLEEVSRALRKRSHSLFERAKDEEKGIKRFWYELKAQIIQYFAIRNTLKASEYSSESWAIRKKLKNQIGENARILGYAAR